MVFLRAITRGILLLAIVGGVTFWIGAATLQTTLLNRDNVKTWLVQSGAYNNLLNSLVQVEHITTKDNDIINLATITSAMQQTFPPTYVQTQTENVLDTTYDWLVGERSDITFTIDTPAQRDTFVVHLSAQLEPKLAALPVCTTLSHLSLDAPSCIPPSTSASSMAHTLAEQTANQSSLFAEPLTQDSFGASGATASSTSEPSWPQKIITAMSWLVFALPLAILTAAALYVLLCSSRLMGLLIVGRRVFFTAALLCVGGGLLWYFGRSAELGAVIGIGGTQQTNAIATEVINPFIQIILPIIGQWLTIFSGFVVIIGGVTWLVAWLQYRKKQKRIRAASVYVPVSQPIGSAGTPPEAPQGPNKPPRP